MQNKTYSVLIAWDDNDREQGEYGTTVCAPDHDEAEAIVRQMMRATGNGSWPFGQLLDCSPGAIWAAADLESALRPIVWQLQRMDDLPEEVETMIADAEKALKLCEVEGQPWGTLHYDGSPEPDWSRFAYLEIDGCAETGPISVWEPEGGIVGGKPDDQAEFWTIYGREKETGFAQALQDCVTRREADHVLRLMMERSGLPGYRVGEPMPDAIKNAPFPHDRDDCDGEHSAALVDDPMASWRYAVTNGETKDGFGDWWRGQLSEELERFQALHGLPKQCALEQWHALPDGHQCRPWLLEFSKRWEQAEREG